MIKPCKNCGLWGEWKEDTCPFCKKHGDRVLIISNDKNCRHLKHDYKCGECDLNSSYLGGGNEIQFPIAHENCDGLIHLDSFNHYDGYSMDINIVFQCDACGVSLDTWTDGHSILDEFQERFCFNPVWNEIITYLEIVCWDWELQGINPITHRGQRLKDIVVRYGEKLIYSLCLGRAINTCVKLGISFSNIHYMHHFYNGLKKTSDPGFVQSSHFDKSIKEWVLNLDAFIFPFLEKIFKYKI